MTSSKGIVVIRPGIFSASEYHTTGSSVAIPVSIPFIPKKGIRLRMKASPVCFARLLMNHNSNTNKPARLIVNVYHPFQSVANRKIMYASVPN